MLMRSALRYLVARPGSVALPAAFSAVLLLATSVVAQSSFVNYESPQVHPIEVSADGLRLYAVNTPDNRLSVYSLADPSRPILLQEIRVGLEPISVRERTTDEVWVVNHLSDSVSVVSIPHGVVTATIRVVDEPADVAFANGRAFISVMTDREVRVFDPLTYAEQKRIAIFGDEPRSLLASADGSKVWVLVSRSGNKTTIVPESIAPPQPPPTNSQLPPPPAVSLIVGSEDPEWKSRIQIDLPDHDLVEIDSRTLSITRNHTGLGTTLLNVCRRPNSKELWVANTEALNLVRFEPNLRGHFIDSRVTRIAGNHEVTPFDLNPSIDYKTLPNPPAVAIALALPTDLVFDPSGSRLYVAAFGTDRIGVLDAQGKIVDRIEIGSSQVDPRSKRGPRGLAHHPSASRLYVMNRIANSISVINTGTRKLIVEIPAAFDPTPPAIKTGRGFLYDAKLSGNGTGACAACHVDGDIDGLAWDLGDPGGEMTRVRQGNRTFNLHPMKGPMTTQTFKGLPGTGPLHWRGDKASFEDFNEAFDKLLGGQELSTRDMDDYKTFIDSITYPPNPKQLLDRTYSSSPPGTSAAEGFQLYTNGTGFPRCSSCHSIDKGTDGRIIGNRSLSGSQDFKTPQLRNMYKRMGRRKQAQGRTSGFGLEHDGHMDDIFQFLALPVFRSLARSVPDRLAVEAFCEAFDTGTAPAVGHSLTIDLTNTGSPETLAYLSLMIGEVSKGNCDLVGHGVIACRTIGLEYISSSGRFVTDRLDEGPWSVAELRTQILTRKGTITLLGVPPGSGPRIGRDRDLDSTPDAQEGLTPYGAGSPGCRGPIMLTASSDPTIGNDRFALVAHEVDPSAFIVIGARKLDAQVLGIRVLADIGIGPLPVPVDARGVAVLSVPIRNKTRWLGKSVFAQLISVSSCGSRGFAASQGLEIRFSR